MRGQSSQQLTFGEGFINPELFQLDEELQEVDKLLCEKSLLKPFEESFDSTMGRSGTPVDVYLRIKYDDRPVKPDMLCIPFFLHRRPAQQPSPITRPRIGV